MDWKDLASTAVYTGMTDENESIWERVDGVDVAFIGAFLTAHLSLENYITDYLGLRYPSLAWGDAKLTFSQKIALIQHEPAKPPYDEIYLRIKDFNSIRNKISHQLNYQITDKENIDIDNMADLLGFFVSMTKSYFASAISYYHYNKKVAGKSNKID